MLAAEHAVPTVRHLSDPGSQQSLPRHDAGEVGQQNWFWCPHAPHRPPPHTVPGPAHCVPCARQVDVVPPVTQHDVVSVQLPLQHACVSPPQLVHLPAVQSTSWPPVPDVHCVLFATHVLTAGSQQPVPLQA